MRLEIAIAVILACISSYVADAKKVFCYYSSFAQGRPGHGKFMPENIDPFLCSHIIYAFVDVTSDGQGLKPVNWNDIGSGGLYKRTLALKNTNPNLKVLLAVGGWIVGSDPFMPIVRSDHNRRAFARNVVKYLRKHGFDGLDMDWEFPATRGSPPEDKHRFTLMMKELYETFATEADDTGNDKLLLTLATASDTYYITPAYEPSQIIKYVDFMLLMTYNYHGHWDSKTGHHAGLWKFPGDGRDFNQNWSIDFWLNAGMDASRLIVGLPTYGMSFTLNNRNNHAVGAPTQGGGQKGHFTKETGILSYYEICDRIQNKGWQESWIDEQGVPYAYGGNQWVGFDNKQSIRMKAENIQKRNLAGAFVWSVEMDDFSGVCGEKYPLLTVISNILKPTSGGSSHHNPVKEWEPAAKKERKSQKSWEDSGESWEEETLRPWWGPSTKRPAAPASAVFDCGAQGYHQDPMSCQHFFHCLPGGMGIRYKCPKGTRFDETLSVCNFAHKVECYTK